MNNKKKKWGKGGGGEPLKKPYVNGKIQKYIYTNANFIKPYRNPVHF